MATSKDRRTIVQPYREVPVSRINGEIMSLREVIDERTLGAKVVPQRGATSILVNAPTIVEYLVDEEPTIVLLLPNNVVFEDLRMALIATRDAEGDGFPISDMMYRYFYDGPDDESTHQLFASLQVDPAWSERSVLEWFASRNPNFTPEFIARKVPLLFV